MVFFFICAVSGIFGNQSAVCNYISGGAFIVGLLLEIVSRKCDGRLETLTRIAEEEAQKQHQSELNSLTQRIVEADDKIDGTEKFTQSLIEGRHLSEEGKSVLKDRLSKFAGQKFTVFQVGWADSEAVGFAREIIAILNDCGWSGGSLVISPNVSNAISMAWGVSIFTILEESDALAGQFAAIELSSAMRDIGIVLSGSYRSGELGPIGKGAIEIHVGTKPPPHAYPTVKT